MKLSQNVYNVIGKQIIFLIRASNAKNVNYPLNVMNVQVFQLAESVKRVFSLMLRDSVNNVP